MKYLAAEIQKCTIGEDDAMGGNLDCSTFNAASASDKADAAVTAAVTALADFKNPHNPSGSGVATLPNILKELFGGGNALANTDDSTSEATVTEGATNPTELTIGET